MTDGDHTPARLKPSHAMLRRASARLLRANEAGAVPLALLERASCVDAVTKHTIPAHARRKVWAIWLSRGAAAAASGADIARGKARTDLDDVLDRLARSGGMV